MSYPDASVTQLYPGRGKAIDLSSADADLTTYFPSKFARRIYVGSNAGNVTVRHIGDTADCTYTAVPVGTVLFGVFTKVVKASTTSTNLVAEE